MKSNTEIIAYLKELLTKDMSSCIAKLKELIPAKSKKHDSLIILQARYTEHNKKVLKGIISEERTQLGFNQIREELLSFISSLEREDFTSHKPLDIEEVKGYEGHLLYKIPPEMTIGKKETCVIRIAIEEEVLLKNFKKTIGVNQEGLEKVTNVMQVILFDPTTSTPFEINAINDSEQLIYDVGYTEWKFWVTPFVVGVFPIILKVAVIEEVNGKERKRDITLEKEIEVLVDEVNQVHNDFENSGVKLNFTSQESNQATSINKKKGVFATMKKFFRSAAALMVLLLVFAFGWKQVDSKFETESKKMADEREFLSEKITQLEEKSAFAVQEFDRKVNEIENLSVISEKKSFERLENQKKFVESLLLEQKPLKAEIARLQESLAQVKIEQRDNQKLLMDWENKYRDLAFDLQELKMDTASKMLKPYVEFPNKDNKFERSENVQFSSNLKQNQFDSQRWNIPNREPGKCYEKTMTPDHYETVSEQVLVKDATDDSPAEYKTVSHQRLVQKGGNIIWREVLCPDQEDGYLIGQIQNKLKSLGYYLGPNNNNLDTETKNALVKYQKDNGLSVGQLDYETLKSLRVNY